MANLNFTKMHSAGNDFVLIDAATYRSSAVSQLSTPQKRSELAAMLCARHFGAGADGLVLLEASSKANFKMSYLNADGTAAMCANAVCCVARLVQQAGFLGPEKKTFELETLKGVLGVKVLGGEDMGRVRVNMGEPIFEGLSIPVSEPGEQIELLLQVQGREWSASAVGMGNPHCIILLEDLQGLKIEQLGFEFETHPFFPEKTNVEFVQLHSPEEVSMRIWERGVGETLSCGTGACAVGAALMKKRMVQRQIRIFTPGGQLEVLWPESSAEIYFTASADEVYKAQVNLDSLEEQYNNRKAQMESRSHV